MRSTALPVLTLVLPAVLFCFSAEAQISSTTLKNGMKVIVEEDHDIPNVAMYLFFKVGSRNERPGTTGLSHFFEHMMFNGSKKYGPKQFDIQMEKAGGRNNAYTTRDLTVYTDYFPSSALRLMFDMEADRIQNLSFDPKMIESERGVVYSERQTSTDNSNSGALYEQLNATAYIAHPYRWPVIGWASDIRAWTMEDLKRHFTMGYAPNNCIAVVVGDVAPGEVFAFAREFFEPIPPQEPPPPVRTVEPEQKGERRAIVEKSAQLPLQMISYHGTNSTNADYLPLQVLGTILTEGRSSRLYRRMVDREQLALDVSHYSDPQLDPGQIIFAISPRAGVDPARTEKVLYEELSALQTAEVAAPELRKAKNLMLTDLYRSMKTIGGRADLLGTYEIYHGDYRKLFTAEKDIEAVTSRDIRRVAQKYFGHTNRTVATLVPIEAGTKAGQ